jgi:phage baseplate assembly protein W
MAMSKAAAYLGTGWAFPPRFGNGRTVMVGAEADIAESLYVLMATRPGERVMHPTYGCGLDALVFEEFTTGLVTQVRQLVARAIAAFEPRVIVQLVAVYADPGDPALLKIEVAYLVRATHSVHNLVYPFYLEPGSARP